MGEVSVNNDASTLVCLHHRLNVLQIGMINPVIIPFFWQLNYVNSSVCLYKVCLNY